MVKLTGGGISSNKTVQSRSGYKVEPKARAINPASVSTLGISTQFKKPNLEMGKGYSPKPQGDTGLIPSPIDQNRCAHWRNPRDMMRHG